MSMDLVMVGKTCTRTLPTHHHHGNYQAVPSRSSVKPSVTTTNTPACTTSERNKTPPRQMKRHYPTLLWCVAGSLDSLALLRCIYLTGPLISCVHCRKVKYETNCTTSKRHVWNFLWVYVPRFFFLFIYLFLLAERKWSVTDTDCSPDPAPA